MKILITGICGFTGSTLARALLEAESGITVYGIDNFARPGSEQNRGPLRDLGITVFHGDIRAAADLDKLPAVDWVIDAAANPSVLAGIDGRTTSRDLVDTNLLGTINVLEYCKRHQAGFILLSTSRVYSIAALTEIAVTTEAECFRLETGQKLPPGVTERGLNESFSTLPPLSLYGCTKLASELLALEYGETFNFPVWIDRCGVLAGAGQFGRPDQGIFAYWINSWIRRRPLKYLGFGGKGFQVRDCLHPRDLVPLIRKQVASPAVSGSVRTINLGGGKDRAISLAGLSGWCRDRFGDHTVSGDPALRRFDIPWLIMDSSLAESTWNWRPETTLPAILEEIARHAELHPRWLELSGVP
jgi:CDP-paratose 2-epimerase